MKQKKREFFFRKKKKKRNLRSVEVEIAKKKLMRQSEKWEQTFGWIKNFSTENHLDSESNTQKKSSSSTSGVNSWPSERRRRRRRRNYLLIEIRGKKEKWGEYEEEKTWNMNFVYEWSNEEREKKNVSCLKWKTKKIFGWWLWWMKEWMVEEKKNSVNQTVFCFVFVMKNQSLETSKLDFGFGFFDEWKSVRVTSIHWWWWTAPKKKENSDQKNTKDNGEFQSKRWKGKDVFVLLWGEIS